MELIKNCENCAFYFETKSFLADGFCYVRKANPQMVRKWFTKCKNWREKEGAENDPQS